MATLPDLTELPAFPEFDVEVNELLGFDFDTYDMFLRSEDLQGQVAYYPVINVIEQTYPDGERFVFLQLGNDREAVFFPNVTAPVTLYRKS